MAQQKSVTLVISHLLDPQHGQRYEEWLGKIMPIAAEFPGHLGANVIRPAAGQNLWSVIIRFDTLEHLYAWTQSETRRQLVAEIAPLLTEGDRTEVRTEPAFWFTPPTAKRAPAAALETISDHPAGDFSQHQPGACGHRYAVAVAQREPAAAPDQ